MTTEEKAKAYDKAIEKIKYVIDRGVEPILNKADLQSIFPELKESEDERIRNFLIDFIKVCGWTEKKDQGWPLREDCIAWLEKQGEQKSSDKTEPKFHEGDWVLNNVCFPVQITSIDGDMYSFSDGTAMSISFIDNNYHLWTIADAENGDALILNGDE